MTNTDTSELKLSKGRPVVYFDIESTGVDTSKDRIVELSMVKVRNGVVIEQWLERFDPEMAIPIEASLIHGIYDIDVIGLNTFGFHVPAILEFIKDCDLGGYNIMRFDVPMLFNEIIRAGYKWDYTEHKYVDVFNIYRKCFPSNLGEVYKKLTGKDMENAHSAQADVMATIEIMLKLHDFGAPTEIDQLNIISTGSEKMLDISGKFKYNDKGEVIFNWGKHAGNVVYETKDWTGYLQWVITSDFGEDVKDICRKLIKKQL